MCGILGIFETNETTATAFIKEGLKIQQNRGIDAVGVSDGSQIKTAKSHSELTIPKATELIAHNLHAIINHIPQPLEKNKTHIVANCEIYNWRELAKDKKSSAKNDAELLAEVISQTTPETIVSDLAQLDGVYASCVWKQNQLVLFRDIMGVKPLHYYFNPTTKIFAFASEQKVLTKQGFSTHHITELNPRQIISFNTESKEINIIQRPFFEANTTEQVEQDIIEKVENYFIKALKKRIPDLKQNKVGVLFSGGIDSTIICHLLQKFDIPFIAYTAALDQDGMSEAEDLFWARKIAKKQGYELNEHTVSIDEVPAYLAKVIPLVESSNVIKVGVALPFYLACENAQKDEIKVMFSGLGSEEIFAGYQRHENSSDINQECVSGLRKIYERDLYRDDVLTMEHNIELRLPFLDKDLITYALTIDAKYKIVGDVKKHILREATKKMGLPIEFADRPKKAAQYGSKFDRAIGKLTKKNGFVLKSAYLNTFFPPQNQKIGALFSGGKDSMYALETMMKQQYPISCLMTMKSKNDDSYMFHTPAIDIAALQAEALNIPILFQETAGEKESELEDLKTLIANAKEQYHLDGIVTGALYSVYQRERIEKIAEELGLKVFSPLWHINQEKEMRAIIESGYELVFTGVAAYGLDHTWVNQPITTTHIDKLVKLEKEIGLNVAGEGGEFESLVLDCPLFTKKIVIEEATIEQTGENSARLRIQKAKLIKK